MKHGYRVVIAKADDWERGYDTSNCFWFEEANKAIEFANNAVRSSLGNTSISIDVLEDDEDNEGAGDQQI